MHGRSLGVRFGSDVTRESSIVKLRAAVCFGRSARYPSLRTNDASDGGGLLETERPSGRKRAAEQSEILCYST